jgi:hypothetical protein
LDLDIAHVERGALDGQVADNRRVQAQPVHVDQCT